MIPILKNWELVLQIAVTDFKLRYQNSVLGFVWTLLEPLLMMTIMWFVFSRVVRVQIPNYQLFLLLGLIMWQFFSRGTSQGLNAVTRRANILSKINIPRRVIVFASCLTNLISFGMDIVVFLAMMIVFGVPFRLHLLVCIPLFLLEFFLIYSVSLVLAPLNLRYRDFGNVWGILLRAGFYMSPILYSMDFVPENLRFWYLCNPVSRLIHATRVWIFPEASSVDHHFWILLVTAVVVYAVGTWLFKRMEPKFGDYL